MSVFNLRNVLLGGAFACLAALWLAVATRSELNALGLIPAAIVAVIQIFQVWIVPWLRYRRSRELDEAKFSAIRGWLETLVEAGRIPRCHLRVQDGRMANAVTSGGAYRPFIVVGRGLLDQLSTDEIKAVLAQKIGHLLNRDMTRRLIPLASLNFALHALFYSSLIAVLGWNIVTAAVGGVGMAFFLEIIPNFFRRRWVFDADRRAAELIGDPGVFARALTRFSEVARIDLDERPMTQPPMRARLEALKQLAQAPG